MEEEKMAKKKSTKNETVEILDIELNEEVQEEEKGKVEETDKVEKVTIIDPIIVKKKVELVKVVPMRDLNNVYIGGVYYTFKKGVEQRVPEDVERVLRERDLIK
jgi:hypothetical protein